MAGTGRRGLRLFVAAAIASIGLGAAGAHAGEKGKFRGLAVLTNVQFQQIKASEGHPGGAVMIGEMDGVIFNDAKKPFLDKAYYHVVWKGDGRGDGECFKTFTMPGGDRLFARCEGKATDTGFEGVVEVTGGTGAYAGARGRGSYKLTNVTERVMWDLLEWDYELQ